MFCAKTFWVAASPALELAFPVGVKTLKFNAIGSLTLPLLSCDGVIT